MSRAPRFVTVSRRVLRLYDEHDIADLVEYFEPHFVLSETPLPGETRQRLGSMVDGPVVAEERETPVTHRVGSVAVAWVSDPADLDALRRLDGHDELVVFTDLIEEEVDVRSFETTLTHLEEYGQRARGLDVDATHFSTALTAETHHHRDGIDIYGAGVKRSLEGTAIPCLSPEEPRGIELLDAEKTGMQAIPGLGRTMRRRLETEGIARRPDLAERDPEHLMSFEGIGPFYAAQFRTSARAHDEDQPYRFAEDPLRGEDLVYVDIETDGIENPDLIWQIGVYDDRSDSYRVFLEDEDPHDAASTVVGFAEWLDEALDGAALVTWYGKQFDYLHLSDFIERHAEPSLQQTWTEAPKHDLLLDVVKPTCAVPARSHALDVVADRLGYERETAGLSGKDAAEAILAWRNRGEEPDWETWIRYCRDDVMAMRHVYEEVREAEQLHDKTRLEEIYDGRTR